MSYPENDSKFEERTVSDVCVRGGYQDVSFKEGFSLVIETQRPIKKGDSVRLYGDGFGHPVRGIFVNGEEVFYRTEADDKEYNTAKRFGATAKEWLERWDNDESVWSVEMGGIGPGYEHCIQIIAAEILRKFIDTGFPTADSTPEDKEELFKSISNDLSTDVFEKLGPSGAQVGAAKNLAYVLYSRGPAEALTDPKVKDRLIQVSKTFPQL
jgi:hypothetical protein